MDWVWTLNQAQVGRHSVSTGEPGESHRVEALAGKSAVAHAIEIFNGGAVKGHGEQAGKLAPGDGPIGTIHSAQEAAVGAWSANFDVVDRRV